VDTVYPILTKNLINPLNNTYSNQSFNFINFTIQDTNYNYLVYKFNNKTLNISNLVLGMNFENNSNIGENDSLVYDFSGLGNNGTIYGAVYTTGKYGSALSFDGVDDYVSVVDSASLHTTEALTVEVWVKPATIASGTGTIFYYGDSSLIGGYAFNQVNDKLIGYFYDSAWRDTGISSTNLVAGNWYHVVMTYDKINLKLYVNGVLEQQPAYTTSINNPAGAYAQIGGASAIYQLFNGTIDEVRIYNRALTANEILLSYYSNIHVNNYTSYDFFSNYSTVSGRSIYNLSVFDKADNLNFSGDYNVFLNVENYLYSCNYSDYEDEINSLTGLLNSCTGELGTCNNSLINMTDLYTNCTIELNNTNLSLIECELNLSLCLNESNSSYTDCMNNLSSCNEDLTAMNLSFFDCELNYSILYNDSLVCNSSLNICNLNLSDYALNLIICENNLTACGINLTACLNATCILSGAGLTDSSFIMLLLIILFIMFLLLRLR
jgi:hypothetical protein